MDMFRFKTESCRGSNKSWVAVAVPCGERGTWCSRSTLPYFTLYSTVAVIKVKVDRLLRNELKMKGTPYNV